MAESKNDLTENKKKRPNKLTNARIKKEIEFLEKMFVGVDDENKKTLINSLIEEAAFLKVACFQAKEELKKEIIEYKQRNRIDARENALRQQY